MTSKKKGSYKSPLNQNIQNQSYTVSEATATPILLGKLADKGIYLDSLKYDCGLYRAHNKGDVKGSKNIAVIAHSSPIYTVWCENHKTGEKITFSVADKNAKPLSRADRRRQAKQIKKDKQKRIEKQRMAWQESATKARELWKLLVPATAENLYLKSKHITEIGRLRVTNNGALAVPMFNNGALSGIEFILLSDQGKRLWRSKGCQGDGSFFIWGKIPKHPDILYLAESLSTSYAIYKMTGKPCVCCFSSGNLLAVGRKVRAKYRATRLIFGADNDIREPFSTNEINTGIIKATEAARVVGAEIAIPNLDGEACDFWDIWNASLELNGGVK